VIRAFGMVSLPLRLPSLTTSLANDIARLEDELLAGIVFAVFTFGIHRTMGFEVLVVGPRVDRGCQALQSVSVQTALRETFASSGVREYVYPRRHLLSN
jgi:hypothetical protein